MSSLKLVQRPRSSCLESILPITPKYTQENSQRGARDWESHLGSSRAHEPRAKGFDRTGREGSKWRWKRWPANVRNSSDRLSAFSTRRCDWILSTPPGNVGPRHQGLVGSRPEESRSQSSRRGSRRRHRPSMHDSRSTSVDAVPKIIEGLEERGYLMVTLSETSQRYGHGAQACRSGGKKKI